MKVIAIYHNKGGVGKTTIAVNLAAAFRNMSKRVLLIDLDSQANATFATGLIKFQFDEDDNIKEANVLNLLKSSEFGFIPEIVKSSQYFNEPEIDVIPSHINLIEEQDKLNKYAATRFRLKSKLKMVEDKYDIVIIDTPPSRDIYAEVALISADYLIIPSDLKPFANQGLPPVKNLIFDQVNETRKGMGKGNLQILGVLPSKISTNPNYLEFVFPRQKAVVIERYGLTLMNSTIFERAALSNCMNTTIKVGDLDVAAPKSIFKFNSKSDSANEFEQLAKEVLRATEKV